MRFVLTACKDYVTYWPSPAATVATGPQVIVQPNRKSWGRRPVNSDGDKPCCIKFLSLCVPVGAFTPRRISPTMGLTTGCRSGRILATR